LKSVSGIKWETPSGSFPLLGHRHNGGVNDLATTGLQTLFLKKGRIPGIPAEAILEIGGTPQVVSLPGMGTMGHGIWQGCAQQGTDATRSLSGYVLE